MTWASHATSPSCPQLLFLEIIFTDEYSLMYIVSGAGGGRFVKKAPRNYNFPLIKIISGTISTSFLSGSTKFRSLDLFVV